MKNKDNIKFETLHKSHKKKIIIGVVVICIIGSVLIFKTTRAKYRFTQSIPFVRGTINYKMPDLNIMAVYQQKDDSTCTEDSCYNLVDAIPNNEYEFNENKSYCKKGEITLSTTIDYNMDTKTLLITPLQEAGTKCYMYFNKIRGNVLLAKYTKVGPRENYQTLTTNNSGKVFSLDDDDGRSYYFAGAVNNNWVKFAGFYWRIIRFNGDKSVRLIYSGTTAATGTGTQIGTSAFNSSSNNNKYVGYRYTNGDVHGTDSSSTIQGVIDTWYETNIVNKGYSGKVESKVGFCGDRDSYTDTNGATVGGGTGETTTFYGAYIRLVKGGSYLSSPTPTLKCKNSSDLYTVNGTKKGNESLKYPVGLITADEVNAAGGIGGTENKSYYLYTNSAYWTMSPSRYYSGFINAGVFSVNSDGSLDSNDSVYYTYGIRPVINLRADTLFSSGDGTSTSPYEVIE